MGDRSVLERLVNLKEDSGKEIKVLIILPLILLGLTAILISSKAGGLDVRTIPVGTEFFQGSTCVLLKKYVGARPEAVIACFDSEGRLMWSKQISIEGGLAPTSLSLSAEGVFIVGNVCETYQSVIIHLGWNGSQKWAKAVSEANLRSSTFKEDVLAVSGSCGYGVNESALVLLINVDGEIVGAWIFDTPGRDVAASVDFDRGRVYVSGTSEWGDDLVSSFVLSFDPSAAEWPLGLPEAQVTCFALPVICSTSGGDYEVVATEGAVKGIWSINLSVISADQDSLVLSAGSAWLPGGDSRSLAIALDRTGRPIWARVGPPGSIGEVGIHQGRMTLIHHPSAGAAGTSLLIATLTGSKEFTSFLVKDAIVMGASVDEDRVLTVAFASLGTRPQIISEGTISWDSAVIESVLGCDAALCSGGLHPVSVDISPTKLNVRDSPPDISIYYLWSSWNSSKVELRPLWRPKFGPASGHLTRSFISLMGILAAVIALLMWALRSARGGQEGG